MIDIKLLRENPDVVRDSIKRRGLAIDVDKVLGLYQKRIALIQQTESLRSKLKIDGKPTVDELANLQEIKKRFEQAHSELEKLTSEYNELFTQIPNTIATGTPDGGEENNQEIERWGDTQLDFNPKDHLELSELYDLYDFEAGSKVSGNKFYFTKHKAVKLWQAIQMATQEIVEEAGYQLIGVPHLVSSKVAEGAGFLPKGEEHQNYTDSSQDLVMIATSEIPLTGLHMDEVLTLDEPIKYAGIGPSYRLEAGAYGKFSKGLYRTHQFDKLEMYVYCKAEQSDDVLQEILNIQKSICQAFVVPYRVVRIASGDLSAPAYQKYDVEYYSPIDKCYRELTSCSNCTDYQSRNLNIKYKDQAGRAQFAHTLNGTAVVSSRMPIAILENHQSADGIVHLPDAIAKYYGKNEL